MPVPIGSTLGIFADNTRIRKSVLPIRRSFLTRWAAGLDLPAGGETVLYTGQMYQLMPSINAMNRQLAKWENSRLTSYFGIGRTVNKLINLSSFMARVNRNEISTYNQPLRSIVALLKKAGVRFGYLYDKDLYSGALVYDEGLDETFNSHAELVSRILKESGVKRVITVDPHTTNMLRHIYPQLATGFNIEVKSYLEIIAESALRPVNKTDNEIVIHDSCVYARYENVVEEPRFLLSRAGLHINEPELSGKLTHCCGGPLESLFPEKSNRLAGKRMGQLTGDQHVVTMCPICMANLKRAATGNESIQDIADVLVKSYCPA